MLDRSPAEFTVLRFVDGWRIIHSGRRWGRFPYQVDAVEAALRLAEKARLRGARPEILVQSASGELTRLQHDFEKSAEQPAA